ncbi:uncharacterized protein LOC110188823 [Drosophila serrata]|uniref:uncharacterized protein LOC110188823 n=1 Tax=Drosophila serrata TaxID=7274 RepID=UPI000A1D1114|nr:uncharacterized protein LOC110188823 [Drosophila serrata]
MYMESDEKKKAGGSQSLLQTYNDREAHTRKAASRQRVKKSQQKKHEVAKPIDQEEEYDDYMALLSNDFILMLDCSPQPDEVFCQESRELGLASIWLNKMITWRCNTLYDLRMRNAYMSHLIVCLNRRQMTGIFRDLPPQELTWVNFEEENKSHHSSPINHMAMACSTWMDKSQPSSCTEPCCSKTLGSGAHPPCHCGGPNRAGSCCSNHRHLGGGSFHGSQIETSTDDKEIKMIMPVRKDGNRPFGCRSACNSLRNLCSSGSRSQSLPGRLLIRNPTESTPTKSDNPKDKNSAKKSEDQPKEASPKKNNRINPNVVRDEMLKLLLTVKKELSGDPDVERNEFLEKELTRYREFAENHKDNDTDWVSAKNEKSLRIYLLLNMQRDLVRMLNEDGVEIPH